MDVAAIGLELCDISSRRAGLENRFGNGDMALANLAEPRFEAGVLLLGHGNQAEESIGNAAAGREHHALRNRLFGRAGALFDDARDAQEAFGVGYARAA